MGPVEQKETKNCKSCSKASKIEIKLASFKENFRFWSKNIDKIELLTLQKLLKALC